ncbi:threonine-phosphate decarboxylase CobD [Tepidiphilus succinatimandens]|uniref:threonine-phosphate decarboxylase CobD n=1 Tax=Tepidiphilus succinatimandens TaxID=224436 RepID=UPI00112F31C1|nr:threonine-phosphate decarboxylase CobD [Tepidiphilus succinatimandens]
MSRPVHGGRLREVARRRGIPVDAWLDLSTGISPWSYPLPPVPEEVWRRLPEEDDGLDELVHTVFGRPALAVPGTQAAISRLPSLLPDLRRVLVPHPSYGEHAHTWRAHRPVRCTPATDAIDARLDEVDALVLVHPNNPTGTRFPARALRAWHRRLAARGGWLIVDEAFLDPGEAGSLVAETGEPGLVVLRSLGKFWGLAGVRFGLVFAAEPLRAQLSALLDPWAVSHPARWAARLALADSAWQERQRARLAAASLALATTLEEAGLRVSGRTSLFAWVETPRASALAAALERRALLVRRFDDPPGLRFGLPADAAQSERLRAALLEAIAETQRTAS